MIRKKCVRDGHDFRSFEGSSIPYLFCRRWFCNAAVAADWVDEPLRSALNRMATLKEAKHRG